MSKLKVSAIHDPDNDNEALSIDTSGNVTVSQGFVPSTQLSHRNLIINGAMQVSQRGDYTSATSITNNLYYLDRYFISIGVVTATIQQTTVTINSVEKKAQKIVATSSGSGYIGTGQRIELDNLQDGQTYTASCWVRSNNSNTSFRTTFTGSYTDTTVFTNDGNWEQVSATFTLNKASLTYIDIGLNTYQNGTVSMSSGDYIEFTDFQVEVGSVATPFEHRSYGEELARCERYYQRLIDVTGKINDGQLIGSIYSSSRTFTKIFMKSVMRASPTITQSNISAKIYTNSTNYTSTNIANIYPERSSIGLDFQGSYGNVGNACHIDLLGTSVVEADAEL